MSPVTLRATLAKYFRKVNHSLTLARLVASVVNNNV